MSEELDKKEMLKDLIKALHAGESPDELKRRFKDVLKDVGPAQIVQVEEELIAEGMPREEIQRLCDIHLAVLRESLEGKQTSAPAGHPVHILMQEHNLLLQSAEELRNIAQEIRAARGTSYVTTEVERIKHIEEHLRDSESHYLREENVLFPYLEKHGVTQPPAIMWMEHDQIRQMKKSIYQLIDARESMAPQDFAKELEEAASALAEFLSSHFYKENNVLFPTALKVIEQSEWKDVRRQFDELGYCCFTPEPVEMTAETTGARAAEPAPEGVVSFETGSLSTEEIEAVFDTLPVDITFVDKEDTVRYFSKSKERIFARTEAVIGLKVQQCHPQKSIHVVNQILEDFKSGRRDVADFWINLGGRFIYIRYFPVCDKNGDYLGCLEVTQDITDMKSLEGEKRLL
jgi:PAS domain S-box-containing protein